MQKLKIARISRALLIAASWLHAGRSFATLTSAPFNVDAVSPSPTGLDTYVLSINDHGQVSGYTLDVANRKSSAFVYDNGAYQPLNPTGGFYGFYLEALNNQGQGVGFDQKTGHSVIWKAGVETSLAVPKFAPFDAYAVQLNDLGDAVGGSSAQGTGAVHAILWKGSQIIDLPTLGGSINQALAINDADVIVGTSSMPSGRAFPVEWVNEKLHQLGTLGGDYAIPADVNSAGIIIGSASTHTGADHVIEWNDGKVSDLGPGQAGSINNEGQIVGAMGNSAMLWENGQRINLNTLLPANSGWNLFSALDINNSGQIIGEGDYHGQERGFLLTPISGSSPAGNTIPLPDPGTAGLLASPLVIFAMRRSLRKQAAC